MKLALRGEHGGVKTTRNHRWAIAGIAVTSVVALSGCGLFTPGPSDTPGAGGNPSLPQVPIDSSPVPMTSATGTLALYYPVTSRLKGTCSIARSTQIVLAEKGNDAFQTIDVSMTLDPSVPSVHALKVSLGEDSEGVARTLEYSTLNPVAGTNAVLTVTGNSYQVKGTAQATETRYGKAAAPEKLPFVIKATCAKG